MGGLYTYAWQKVRAAFLKDNPRCAEHARQGRLAIATVVDHTTPHNGDEVLFWDKNNWQPLCKPCHDAKTCAEDGGLGNKKLSASDARKPRIGCDASGFPIDRNHHWRK